MEYRKEGKGRMSVPAFGEWDMKNGMPDYSMDFTKLREMKLQNKTAGGLSYGNEDEMLRLHASADGGETGKDEKGAAARRTPAAEEDRRPINDHHQHRSPTGRKRFINYFQCCIGAA